MQPDAISGRRERIAARPLVELLDCPPETRQLLNGAAQCIDFEAGAMVFRQSEICRGLYVVVSGQFVRRTERLATRIALGAARAGELVELAAALGDGRHTYTLTALTSGAMLLLPMQSLNQAFHSHPPLRMQLLEELAREVSRGYFACCNDRVTRLRRRGPEAAL